MGLNTTVPLVLWGQVETLFNCATSPMGTGGTLYNRATSPTETGGTQYICARDRWDSIQPCL